MTWEYKRVSIDILDVPDPPFEQALNSLGIDGWELVGMLQHTRGGYSHEVHLVLKRARKDSSSLAAE